MARRLSTSSHEAFTDFCSKNQPLSRRLSNGGDDMDSVTSKNRRDSISKDRGQRVLKRRNQTRNPAKAGSMRPSTQRDKENIGTPEPKKRRTTRSGARSNVDNENDGGSDKNVPLMMSPTPYWKVSLFHQQTSSSSQEKISILIFESL